MSKLDSIAGSVVAANPDGPDHGQPVRTSESAGQQAIAYLQSHNVVTLATEADGVPWAAAVFYVNDGFNLYFLSSPTSRHCSNLANNPRAAGTIQEDYADWASIKGVQLEGVASQLSGNDEQSARKLYEQKFPIVSTLGQAPEAIVKAMSKVRWYRLVPQRLYFIDNSAGFGARAEVDVGFGG